MEQFGNNIQGAIDGICFQMLKGLHRSGIHGLVCAEELKPRK